MAFEAEIGVNKHKLMWSKSIASLASIAETITFSITKDTLSLSTNNLTKTTHAEIIFKKSFFSTYSVDFKNILPEGFNEGRVDSELTYSFLVNSRHLTTVFKGLDSNSMKYACIRINWSQEAPINLRYKLFIEMKTKKLIVKNSKRVMFQRQNTILELQVFTRMRCMHKRRTILMNQIESTIL